MGVGIVYTFCATLVAGEKGALQKSLEENAVRDGNYVGFLELTVHQWYPEMHDPNASIRCDPRKVANGCQLSLQISFMGSSRNA